MKTQNKIFFLANRIHVMNKIYLCIMNIHEHNTRKKKQATEKFIIITY
jgi:hypothetical protein